MKYFFILGNHPDLSWAEIVSVLGDTAEYQLLLPNCLLVSTIQPLDAKRLIFQLGGTIKIGEVLGRLTDLPQQLPEILGGLLQQSSRPFFGISLYGGHYNFLPTALTVKKANKIANRSPRFVVSREAVLSSVVVEQNYLTDGGLELVLIKEGQAYNYGRTLAVQPFKDLSKRDYGRPARDEFSGMLPPKIAQIMLNLAKVAEVGEVYDPFCGSGTVLSEAAVMGATELFGSDVSAKAVADTRDNLQWLERGLQRFNVHLAVGDARRLSDLWPEKQWPAIVFEGFLGPQRGSVDWPKQLVELSGLYNEILPQLHRRLTADGLLVMALPYIPKLKQGLTIKTAGWHKADRLIATKEDRLSQPLLYGRPGQKVWRQIIVLKK